MVRVMGYLFHTLASKLPSAISCYHRDAGKKWELPRHGKTYFHKTMCTVPCPALFSLAIQIPTYTFHFPFFAPNRQGKSVVIARICIFNAEAISLQKTCGLTRRGRPRKHLILPASYPTNMVGGPSPTCQSQGPIHIGIGMWEVGSGK